MITHQTDIETRSALPDYLRKLSDKYSRQQWQNHNNFNQLTQFWLSRHIMFRDLIARLRLDTTGLLEIHPGELPKSTLYKMTGFFLNQLHEHHTIEDHHYFPLLIPLDGDLARGFDILAADHHALDKIIDDLAQKTNELILAQQLTKDPRPAAEAVLATQQKLEKFLHRHLSDEEELIVPIILEYGSLHLG